MTDGDNPSCLGMELANYSHQRSLMRLNISIISLYQPPSNVMEFRFARFKNRLLLLPANQFVEERWGKSRGPVNCYVHY